MPVSVEQRQEARYPIRLPVVHTANAAAAGVGWTRNLGERGACVELDERLPPATVCALWLEAEGGPIEVEAQVAWAGEPEVGGGILHGVLFTRIAPEEREALRDLIRARAQVRQGGVRLPLVLPVTGRVEGQPGGPLYGRTGDISHGGLSLRLLQAFPPSTALELTLHSPRGGPLILAGTVVWVDPPERRSPGALIAHGVRFTALDWSASQALARLLAQSMQSFLPLFLDRKGASPPR